MQAVAEGKNSREDNLHPIVLLEKQHVGFAGNCGGIDLGTERILDHSKVRLGDIHSSQGCNLGNAARRH